MKRTRFLFLPTLVILVLLVGLFGLVGEHLGRARAAGTTVTNCNDSGPGSLRDTLTSAASGSTITFSLSCDIQLNSTLTISTNNLTLDGEGQQVTLDGQGTVQDLMVPSDITFTLNALTIANGSAATSCSSTSPKCGGGLFNSSGGKVTITNSTFSNNSANSGPGTSPRGGGLFNSSGGTVTITNSTFANNGAGGIAQGGSGGGLDNAGTATITNSTFSNNRAASGSGGGLLNDGTATITNSTFTNNSAGRKGGGSGPLGDGGGIANRGTVTITNSTFANNSAGGLGNIGGFGSSSGGGIANSSGTMTITNSTITNNSDSGLLNGSPANSGTVTITNSTFANNSDRGLFNDSPGDTVNLGGSIVANNTRGNCGGSVSLHDNGYNLSNDTSCGFTASTSLQNTDPKLDPAGLQNNGGPTQTIALEPDSPAVDKIPVGSSCPATDQRGVSRPQGPACDIGAFEMTAADGLTVMIHVVDSFQLSNGLQTSLDAKLQAALASVKAGNTSAACGQLGGFSNAVQAQSGKGLTTAQATQLVNEATVITTRLGC